MADTVYLVIANHYSEYYDHSETIAAYTSAAQAEEHVRRLTRVADDAESYDEGYPSSALEEAAEELGDVENLYDDPSYKVRAIALYRHLDEFIERPTECRSK